MQYMFFTGNLGHDPEMRYLSNGDPVTNFSVAVNEVGTTPDGQRKERTVWFSVSAWGRLAETCNEYLAKGHSVSVGGKMKSPRVYQANNGEFRSKLEVNAQEVDFHGHNNGQQQDRGNQGRANQPQGQPRSYNNGQQQDGGNQGRANQPQGQPRSYNNGQQQDGGNQGRANQPQGQPRSYNNGQQQDGGNQGRANQPQNQPRSYNNGQQQDGGNQGRANQPQNQPRSYNNGQQQDGGNQGRANQPQNQPNQPNPNQAAGFAPGLPDDEDDLPW